MSQRPPILVIEDEASVMAFVKAALARSGYTVVSANSGAAALPLLETADYLGVISDMRTPGGVDGADVHDWLKANRPELHHKLIYITGDIVNEDTARTLRRTGAPCVEKPFRVQELITVVQKVFGTSS
jgi:CheY-like chemotaxis protein